MKKLTVIIVLSVIAISCKKARKELVVGSKLGIEYTEYNECFGTENTGSENQYFRLDLDNDGVNDVRLNTILNQYNYPGFQFFYERSISVINKDFSLVRDLDNMVYYYGVDCGYNPIHSYEGTFAKLTHTVYDGCKNDYPCGQIEQEYYASDYLYKGERLKSDFNWNNSDALVLARNVHISPYYWFNNTNDTLIGIQRIVNYSCTNLVENEVISIPFSKLENGERYLGWITIKLININSIQLIESAMQKH